MSPFPPYAFLFLASVWHYAFPLLFFVVYLSRGWRCCKIQVTCCLCFVFALVDDVLDAKYDLDVVCVCLVENKHKQHPDHTLLRSHEPRSRRSDLFLVNVTIANSTTQYASQTHFPNTFS